MMTVEEEFKIHRRIAQIRMQHVFGYCKTNNCKLGFPQSSGFDIGRSVSNTDPKNINCEDKEELK